MKVKELIVQLLDYNLDAEVVTNHTETVELSYIGDPLVKDCSDKQSTPFVFIDGCDLVDS
jgi:hypothetical protein